MHSTVYGEINLLNCNEIFEAHLRNMHRLDFSSHLEVKGWLAIGLMILEEAHCKDTEVFNQIKSFFEAKGFDGVVKDYDPSSPPSEEELFRHEVNHGLSCIMRSL